MSVGVAVFSFIAIGLPVRRSKLLLLRLHTLPAASYSFQSKRLPVRWGERQDEEQRSSGGNVRLDSGTLP
ncbi:hypothetical protein VZT92_027391 [Zoarces viviparus]|uniref:NADH dehydrogenase subunit 4 n=1 Tax=Zoarces viviparus TaxID=48416 RepID=A0AAW1DV46_ZOAVI